MKFIILLRIIHKYQKDIYIRKIKKGKLSKKREGNSLKWWGINISYLINRLQYSIYYKNKLIWLNIIYEDDKIPLLNYINFNNNHIKRESMDQKIIEMGYYWYGYSKDIENIIKSCKVCH